MPDEQYPSGSHVDVLDRDGNVLASEVMDYEVDDFLRLRVDPEVAKGCQIRPSRAAQ